MCLIISANPGTEIPHELIENTFYHGNGDGWGLSAWNPLTGEFEVRKGLNWYNLLYCLEEIDSTWDRIVHMRMATRGIVDISNCHPFDVGNNLQPRVVMHHNGTISAFSNYIKPTIESDSLLFSRWIQQNITYRAISTLKHPEIQNSLVQISQSQLAFHFESGEKILLGEENWFEWEGLMFSNTYAWSYYYYGSSSVVVEVETQCKQ